MKRPPERTLFDLFPNLDGGFIHPGSEDPSAATISSKVGRTVDLKSGNGRIASIIGTGVISRHVHDVVRYRSK